MEGTTMITSIPPMASCQCVRLADFGVAGFRAVIDTVIADDALP
jgi:hypothetical protein